MTKIYLIRHAEAEGNYYRRIQGWYDGRITARGRLQIAALAERFRDIPIDALYSSDLQRTRDTAGAILKYHKKLELVTSERLREVNMGVWEDVPWGNAFHDEPEQMLYFSTDPERWSVSGGERFSALQERIKSAIEDIARRHDGQTIAIVSHGSAIRSMICYINSISSENISEIPHGDNTCVALLNYEDGGFTAEFFNDNSHLPEAVSTFAGQSWWKAVDKSALDMANLRLIPMSLEEDAELYKSCYAESWMNAHGTLSSFDGEVYLKSARAASKENPLCLMKAYAGGEDFAGLIELDSSRQSQNEAGWISFIYIAPELRSRNLGPQLLGHAVSFFRRAGRKSIRLHVAENNARAISFYEREGFSLVSKEKGVSGTLLMLEFLI